MTFEGQDRNDLEAAVELLESPSFVAKVSDVIGEPIEKVVSGLPEKASKKVDAVVHSALVSLMNLAGNTLGDGRVRPASTITHKLAATVSGAIGGAFGLAALSVELPITTSIILRSIADIARSEGEDLGSIETRLACIEVFALGGAAESDDASETGYYAVRAGLSKLAPTSRRAAGPERCGAEGGRLRRPVRRQDQPAVQRHSRREAGSPGGSDPRRSRRRHDQLPLSRPLPEHGPRPLHRPSPGEEARRRGRQEGVRPDRAGDGIQEVELLQMSPGKIRRAETVHPFDANDSSKGTLSGVLLQS